MKKLIIIGGAVAALLYLSKRASAGAAAPAPPMRKPSADWMDPSTWLDPGSWLAKFDELEERASAFVGGETGDRRDGPITSPNDSRLDGNNSADDFMFFGDEVS